MQHSSPLLEEPLIIFLEEIFSKQLDNMKASEDIISFHSIYLPQTIYVVVSINYDLLNHYISPQQYQLGRLNITFKVEHK